MAVTFKPKKTGTKTFVFGGTETAPAGDNVGVAGPFPRYNISREVLRNDSVILGQKYTISVTGTALIVDAASMLEEGLRQNEVQKLILRLLDSDARFGTLTIDSYGGKADKIYFDGAVLTGVELPEADEVSAGVQNQNYTVTFEATRLRSQGGDKDPQADDDYDGVSDITESWNVSVSDQYGLEKPFYPKEGEPNAADDDVLEKSENLYRTFTVSHSISATGFDTIIPDGKTHAGTIKRGWEHAKDAVTQRTIDIPIGAGVGTTGQTPKDMNPLDKNADYKRGKGTVIASSADTLAAANIAPLDIPTTINQKTDQKYVAYGLVRTKTFDINAGTYSVEETWTVGRYAATHSVEFSINADPNAEYNTVDVSVTVNGLESITGVDVDSNNEYMGRLPKEKSKYYNALISFDKLKANLPTAAGVFYSARKSGLGIPDDNNLRALARSQSETHNEIDGVISYSVQYDDDVICDPNVLDESISLTYSNLDALNQLVVLHPVIGRAQGPILQNMGTTTERTLSISIDRTMAKNARSVKPDGASLAATYVPATGAHRKSNTESWNPKSGAYNLSQEWVWVCDVVVPAAAPPECGSEEEEE